MPFNLDILNRKKTIIRNDGIELVDLTSPSVQWKNSFPKIMKLIQLAMDMSMRPDLLSQMVYGRTDDFDKILKFNAISNPFSLEGGDVLSIPELIDMSVHLTNTSYDTEDEQVRNQYIDPTKQRSDNLSRYEFETKINALKKASTGTVPSQTNVPPNIADVGDSEYKVIGGKIYFGPDITRTKPLCNEPISKSEFRSRLVKNRLTK